MAEIIAKLADGTELHFPDGTKDEVVQAKVREYMGKGKASPKPSMGISQMSEKMTGKSLAPTDDELIAKHIQDVKKKEAKPKYFEDILGAVVPFARTGASAAVGGIGTILSAPTGPYAPVIGNAAMSITDETLRKYATGEEPGSFTAPKDSSLPTRIAAQFLENEALGRATGAIARGAKATAQTIAKKATEPAIQSLGLSQTYSQMGSAYRNRPWAEFIENSLAPKQKGIAVEQGAKIAIEKAEDIIYKLTGNKEAVRGPVEHSAFRVQNRLGNAFEASLEASNFRGNEVIKIVENPANVLPTSAQLAPYGSPHIAGPILLDELGPKAEKLLTQFSPGAGTLDTTKPYLKTLENISTAYQKGEPISFAQAWEWKKELGEYAYKNPKSAVSVADARFKPLFFSIDNDIENGLKNLPFDSKGALANYQRAKSLVRQRHVLFAPGGKVEGNFSKMLNNLDANNTQVDDIASYVNEVIDHPSQLKRALMVGRLSFPEVGFKVNPTRNMKNDLASYQFKRFLDDAVYQNPHNPESYLLDGKKLLSNFNSPKYQTQVKDLYNANARADIENLFRQISFTDTQGKNVGPSHYLALRIGTGVTLGLASGVAAALKGEDIPKSTFIGTGVAGLTFGAMSLGRLMTNKATARIMSNALTGGPTGMSPRVFTYTLGNALRGEYGTLDLKDGTKLNVRFGTDGKYHEVKEEENK